MNTNQRASIKTNEQGLVSMIIVVILMIIISIITLSFAAVARNEQRQALDRQLNSQSYYAAESGINYANKVIEDQVSAGVPLVNLVKPNCPPDTGYYPDPLVLDNGVSVSCLLVQTNPKSLVYDLDTSQQSKVFPVKPEGAITRVKLEWTPQSGGLSGCPTTTSQADALPAAAAWSCPYAVLRVDLTNTSAGFSRDSLARNTFSSVFMPTVGVGGSGNTAYAGKNAFGGGNADQGTRNPANCTSTSCTMTITFSSANASEYYMRVAPIYRNTTLTVTALNVNTPVSLKDAQLVIDSTGKSQDILRRIQVRIPLINDGLHADYGIQSKESVCKAFTVFDASYTNVQPCS